MNKKIAVIGDWHLAFVTSAVLADCGHDVQLVKPLNLNPKLWESFPPIPVMEPGLDDMIARNKQRLTHRNGIDSDLNVEGVWLAVDTPVNDRDEPQLEPLLAIADQLAKLKHTPKVLIVSSQIPLGFCHELQERTGLPVAYVPENLRLGKGIETFQKADRTVIGSDDPKAAEWTRDLMAKFQTEFLVTNATTSEMVKHANNAFLAMSISFANELARIGEFYGVDGITVGKALKLDKRIGPAAYVIPGLGFAGGTLPRDLRVLQRLGLKQNAQTSLVDAVLEINERTTQVIAEIVVNHIKENKLPEEVLILGYTYKADTDTLRRSLSLDIAQILKQKGLSVLGFDSMMNKKDISAAHKVLKHLDDLQELKSLPGVCLLMTARPNFREINWGTLQKLPKASNKSLVMDTQNFLSATDILKNHLAFKQLWSITQFPAGGEA